MKVIVFDFDGVIVDSNRLKEEAFSKIFKGTDISPALVDEIQRENTGTRFDMLRDIFVKSGRSENEIARLVDEYAARFDETAQGGIVEQGMFSGAREILERLSGRYPLYLNSMTPQIALEKTVGHLGIGYCFRQLCGWPPVKEEHMKNIIVREDVTPREVVMVGDGEGDFAAARATGCMFIGVANEFNQWRGKDFPIIAGVHEFEDALQHLNIEI